MSHNKNCSCSTPLPFPAANQVVAHALETSGTGRGQNDLVAYQDALNRAAIVAITDPSGRITEVNDLFCRISGYARQELIGADHRIVNSGHHSGGFFQQMWRAISSGNIWRADICNRAKDGHLYWVDTTIAPRKDPYGTINGYVAIRFDISRRKEAELEIATQLRRLKTAEKLLADIVETIPSGLVAYHQDGRILFSNSAYERLCGTPCATPDGALWPGEVCYPYPLDAPADSAPHAATDSDTDTEALSRPYIQRLESGRWVQVHDRRSASGNLVSVRTDISELKRTQMQVKRQAEEDPLTGVGNRSKLMRRLTAVTRSRRSSDGVAMLMVIDLDEFKLINDRFGHAGGDTLLQQVARRLRESVRKSDTVARLGGDEFAVLMRAVNGRDAERIAGNLLASICEPLRIGHHAITPSASIGVTLFPKDAKTPSELIKNADLALYQAKHKGRRTYSLYEKSVGHRRQRRMRLLEKLKDAIQSRQIDVALQPKCDLSSGRHTGFEALVRWRPGGVAVPPPELISIAEEAGLICELSEIIITRALSAMAGFKHAGLEPGTMAFNIVAAQLQQPDFVERFITLLDVHGLAPCEIEIEVTENVILDRSAGNFASILRKSREAGFSIALDDFGTGYASLVHLKQFPMDFLKIDRSFIAGILTAKDDAIIVRTIISLAHNLGLRVIAEGVETTDQVKLLSNLGCDLVQGFLLARPMSEQQAHKYLKTIHKTGSYLRHQMQDCLKYR